ncbi:hypothetical protein EVAR_63571_1 [Eumeta japonica]|uniref:Uncharacterized protein n=1 Tax=Eumeta variegata TaxID=151549 RepID=A0A4C1ZQ95_EUMVA|nr:hypothetical protein EVAR_63571_1 [Eumeta japonica]
MALDKQDGGRRWLKFQFVFHLTYSALLSAMGLYLNSTDYEKFDDGRVKIYEYLRFRLLTIWFHFFLLAYFPVAVYLDWCALRGVTSKHVHLLDDVRQTAFTALIFPTTWPEIKRSCQRVYRHHPRPSRPFLGVVVKWWVAAPSGPENLDDPEKLRRSLTSHLDALRVKFQGHASRQYRHGVIVISAGCREQPDRSPERKRQK